MLSMSASDSFSLYRSGRGPLDLGGRGDSDGMPCLGDGPCASAAASDGAAFAVETDGVGALIFSLGAGFCAPPGGAAAAAAAGTGAGAGAPPSGMVK